MIAFLNRKLTEIESFTLARSCSHVEIVFADLLPKKKNPISIKLKIERLQQLFHIAVYC